MSWKSWFARDRSKSESPPRYERDPAVDDVRAVRDIAALEHALDSESVLVRVAALQALASVPDSAAAGLVTRATRDPWRAVRIVASESMAQLMGAGIAITDVGAIPGDALASRRRAVASLSPESLAHYVTGLTNPDAAIRLAAAEVLGETGAGEAAVPLVRALADADMTVVSQASESLVRLGDVAVPSLREAAKGSNKMVLDSAAWCLQQIGKTSTAG